MKWNVGELMLFPKLPTCLSSLIVVGLYTDLAAATVLYDVDHRTDFYQISLSLRFLPRSSSQIYSL